MLADAHSPGVKGGFRPLVREDDGRHNPNKIAFDGCGEGHHERWPGAWIPHARALEPEEEIGPMLPLREVMYPWTLVNLLADEDLMPYERKWKEDRYGHHYF